jgi:hypothetical protein
VQQTPSITNHFFPLWTFALLAKLTMPAPAVPSEWVSMRYAMI